MSPGVGRDWESSWCRLTYVPSRLPQPVSRCCAITSTTSALWSGSAEIVILTVLMSHRLSNCPSSGSMPTRSRCRPNASLRPFWSPQVSIAGMLMIERAGRLVDRLGEQYGERHEHTGVSRTGASSAHRLDR